MGFGKLMKKKTDERVWIEKNKNICDDCFIQQFPDFSYEGSTALAIWRMSWTMARDTAENEKKLIQLI
jgi:hypothetical protein